MNIFMYLVTTWHLYLHISLFDCMSFVYVYAQILAGMCASPNKEVVRLAARALAGDIIIKFLIYFFHSFSTNTFSHLWHHFYFRYHHWVDTFLIQYFLIDIDQKLNHKKTLHFINGDLIWKRHVAVAHWAKTDLTYRPILLLNLPIAA